MLAGDRVLQRAEAALPDLGAARGSVALGVGIAAGSPVSSVTGGWLSAGSSGHRSRLVTRLSARAGAVTVGAAESALGHAQVSVMSHSDRPRPHGHPQPVYTGCPEAVTRRPGAGAGGRAGSGGEVARRRATLTTPWVAQQAVVHNPQDFFVGPGVSVTACPAPTLVDRPCRAADRGTVGRSTAWPAVAAGLTARSRARTVARSRCRRPLWRARTPRGRRAVAV